MTGTAKKAISLTVIAIILAALIAGNVVASMFAGIITNFFSANSTDFSGEETQQALQQSDELVRTLAEDSIVLLKNQEDSDGEPALPLTEDELKVNLFGFSAYDPSSAASFDGFLMKGIGSGSSTISQNKAITLQGALEENGIEYNTDLEAIYDNFNVGRGGNSGNAYWLDEPEITEEQFQQAEEYSDVAIVVFSRLGGENIGEQPHQQTQGAVNPDKTYLEITDPEQELLDEVTARFDKVIVLLNTSNAMHCGFLDDEYVDAAMYVGLTGQSGAIAIGEILKGETLDGESFSPSGKLSDLYSYDPSNDPAYNNTESASSGNSGTNIQYSEGLYYGYRWYETADAEGYFEAQGITYEDQVQFPFGFGLSYTTFEWEVMSIAVGEENVSLGSAIDLTDANKNTTITLKVLVTNTGDWYGKDVVELYYTPEYITGEIEKAEVNLLDFDKTVSLEPGQSEELTLTFTAYDMASFDATDANNNGASTYELDAGTYTISLRTDSHTLKMNGSEEMENATIDFSIADDITFPEDPVTGETVEPLFTGEDAYAGVPIDGSTAGVTQEYLSRADFEGTFPRERAPIPTNAAEANQIASNWYDPTDDTDTAPTQGVDNGADTLLLTYTDAEETVQYNNDLFETLSDYDAEEWDTLLNQISVSDLLNLVHFSGFFTPAIESVGKPRQADFDGPAGFNNNTLSGAWEGTEVTETWTAYPCECLLGCSWNKDLLLQMGLSMGVEASLTEINGWYAPGINLHRTNYTSRNYEYYSEDPILSGNLAANVIHGAKINGLYCYMKHFVVSESGPNGRDWNTWLPEQVLREIYLKPFEIAVKEGGSNAVMSSFNNLGSIWTGANRALLTDILREEWGFRGTVITDWSDGGNPGGMNPRQGVRAGNDIWLNPNAPRINGGLNSSDPTDVACARRSAHNVLYTLVDTIHYYNTFDRDQLDTIFNANVGVATREEPFAWWIILLVAIDVIVVAGLAVWVVFLFKPKKKQQEA